MQFSFDIDNDPSNTGVFFKLSKSLSLTNEAYASQSMQIAICIHYVFMQAFRILEYEQHDVNKEVFEMDSILRSVP